ncbi:hypothetical protein WAI99_22790, partial [Acinetobacter baumannii]
DCFDEVAFADCFRASFDVAAGLLASGLDFAASPFFRDWASAAGASKSARNNAKNDNFKRRVSGGLNFIYYLR